MGKVKLSTLKLNPNNPRKISSEAMDGLKKSIRDFEKMLSLRPIVVDSDGMVLGGNMRLTALRQLGYKEIPSEWVKVADDLTEEEKQEFIIKDNPTKWAGEWDWDALMDDWNAEDLLSWGIDIDEQRQPMQPEQKPITPYIQTHVLVSFPPELFGDVEAAINQIIALDGVEVEYGSN